VPMRPAAPVIRIVFMLCSP